MLQFSKLPTIVLPSSFSVATNNFFNNKCQRRWFRFPGSRWGNRLCKWNRRVWKNPTPLIPKTEAYSPERMRRERLDQVAVIPPIWQSRRTPLMAYKVGSLNLWDEWGERHLVTVLKVEQLEIMEHQTIAKHGMEGIKYGMGNKGLLRSNRAQIGEYMKLKIGMKHIIDARKCSSDCLLPVKHLLSVRHFTPGQWVMIGGFTEAKGFQGVVKRWSMQGQDERSSPEAFRRHAGSTGASGQTIVRRGKRMAGHMGPDPRTTVNKVFRIESKRNLLFVKGSIPSPVGKVVTIWDGRGQVWQRNKDIDIPWPTFVPKPNVEYPVTQQCPPSPIDPFLYTERPIYGKDH